MPSIKQILQSGFYKNAESQAKKIADNAGKVLELISKAASKLEKLNPASARRFTSVTDDLKLFFGMLKAYYNRQYRSVPWKTLVKMLSAIIYFLLIIDLIPDFIPIGGYIDDIALFAWVINSIRSDLDKFKIWKENQEIYESKQSGTADISN